VESRRPWIWCTIEGAPRKNRRGSRKDRPSSRRFSAPPEDFEGAATAHARSGASVAFRRPASVDGGITADARHRWLDYRRKGSPQIALDIERTRERRRRRRRGGGEYRCCWFFARRGDRRSGFRVSRVIVTFKLSDRVEGLLINIQKCKVAVNVGAYDGANMRIPDETGQEMG
jgi:hypothetical protein